MKNKKKAAHNGRLKDVGGDTNTNKDNTDSIPTDANLDNTNSESPLPPIISDYDDYETTEPQQEDVDWFYSNAAPTEPPNEALKQVLGNSTEQKPPLIEIFETAATELGLTGQAKTAYVTEQVAKATEAAAKEQPRPAFKFHSFNSLLKLPDPEYIVSGLVTKQSIGMIYGEPGAGKSFVVVDLLVNCAIGLPVANRFATPKPMNCLYATSEGQGGIKARFTAAVNRMADPQQAMADLNKRLAISLDVPQLFDPHTPQNAENFITEAKSLRLDLLIIDTLNNASLGANENDTRDMTKVVSVAKAIRDALGCAVLLVHHSNRSGSYRGSSSLHGAMDLMIEIKNTPAGREMSFSKLKDRNNDSPVEGQDLFYFRLQGEHYSQSAYVEWADDALNVKAQQAKAVKLTKVDIACNEIEALLAENGVMKQQDLIEAISQAGRNATLQALQELEADGKLKIFKGEDNKTKYCQLSYLDSSDT